MGQEDGKKDSYTIIQESNSKKGGGKGKRYWGNEGSTYKIAKGEVTHGSAEEGLNGATKMLLIFQTWGLA